MSADAVAAVTVANRKDFQGKLPRLNNKDSLWSGLRSLDLPDITYRSSHRIPPHVVATTSWESSTNNAVIYAWGAMMSRHKSVQSMMRLTRRQKRSGHQLLGNSTIQRNVLLLHCPKMTAGSTCRNDAGAAAVSAVHRHSVRFQAQANSQMEAAALSRTSDPSIIESLREQVGYQPPSPANSTEMGQSGLTKAQ